MTRGMQAAVPAGTSPRPPPSHAKRPAPRRPKEQQRPQQLCLLAESGETRLLLRGSWAKGAERAAHGCTAQAIHLPGRTGTDTQEETSSGRLCMGVVGNRK